MQALGENLWSLHHMDPPGQRMFDPNAWILVQTHPSIQHPARYVEAWTIRQTTVREADEGNQKIQVHPSSGEDEASRRRCPNCTNEHPGECPCGWCNQPGHILSQCTARHDSEVMRQRFPKRIKRKKPRRQQVPMLEMFPVPLLLRVLSEHTISMTSSGRM